MGTPSIRVQCLGTFSVTIGGQPVRRWQAGKARNLFQYLLLERGRPVSREALHDALWPEASRGVDSSSLRVAVHNLRRILTTQQPDDSSSDADADSEGSRLDLETAYSGYRMIAENVFIDFVEFERAIADAGVARRHGREEEADARYQDALDLYRGDFLPDEVADWTDVRRQGFRSAALCALEQRLETAVRDEDAPAIVDLSRRMLEIEPYREDAYRALMLLHGRMGQFTEVGTWYDLCVRMLRKDLSVDPERATRAMYKRALRGDFARAALPLAQ